MFFETQCCSFHIADLTSLTHSDPISCCSDSSWNLVHVVSFVFLRNSTQNSMPNLIFMTINTFHCALQYMFIVELVLQFDYFPSSKHYLDELFSVCS